MDRNLSESLVQEGFSSLRGMVREQKGYKTLDDFTNKTTIMGMPAKEYRSTKNPDFGYADFYNDGFRMAGGSGTEGPAFGSSDPISKNDPPLGIRGGVTAGGRMYTGSGRSSDKGGKRQAARMRGIKEQSPPGARREVQMMADRERAILSNRPSIGDRVVDAAGRGFNAGKAGAGVAVKGGSRLFDRLMDKVGGRERTGPLLRPKMPKIPRSLPSMPGQRPMTGPLIRPGSGQPIMDRLLRKIDKGGQYPTPPTRRQTGPTR